MNAPDTDLDWLAQQYLLGELDGPAAARFEAAVARDDEAAAALADAMRLMAVLEGLRPAAPAVVTTARSRWQATPRALGIAGAALAAALAWLWLAPGLPDGAPGRDRDQALALLTGWREAATFDEAEEGADEEADADDDVPAWLLAAVELEPGVDGTAPVEN